MKKSGIGTLCFLLVSLLCSNVAIAQNYQKKLKNAKGVIVTFQSSYKGKTYGDKMLMTICGNRVSLKSADYDSEQGLKTSTYLDYDSLKAYRLAILPSTKVISSDTPFELGKGLKELRKDKMLGLNCTVYRAMVNSNTIDIWCTTELPLHGTPNYSVGVPDGLVLKVVRNGDMVQEAVALAPLKKAETLFPSTWGENMEGYKYTYAINQSGVITVPIFDQQTVCFNNAKLPENLQADETYSCAGGTIILKKVKLPENIKDRSVFLEVVQYSEGDAYDRTGSVFMIPTDKKQSFIDALHNLNSVPYFRSGDVDYHGLLSCDDYDVPVELMRFFTGFGVRQFNHNKVPGQTWVDSVLYKTEVTPLAQKLTGEVWIGAYIGNWDAKGHRVSTKLKYYPGDEDGNRMYKHVMPLFNTVNYMEQAGQPYPIFMQNDSLTVQFEMKEAAKNVQLYYITTGHGGWGGGDEFNPKPNTISLDGKKVITFIPWRDDCGTYRNNNPCSGNFSNGLSSSDLSRSNWCPGTVTNPDYIYLGDLDAGMHKITVRIPQGAPEGGSNSYWCISGTLIY